MTLTQVLKTELLPTSKFIPLQLKLLLQLFGLCLVLNLQVVLLLLPFALSIERLHRCPSSRHLQWTGRRRDRGAQIQMQAPMLFQLNQTELSHSTLLLAVERLLFQAKLILHPLHLQSVLFFEVFHRRKRVWFRLEVDTSSSSTTSFTGRTRTTTRSTPSTCIGASTTLTTDGATTTCQ